MSHFTVLLVLEDVLTRDDHKIQPLIEEAMAPFQENNMGDCPREYLEFNDEEDEYRKQYEEEGTERIEMPDGRLLLPWADEFKQPPKKKEDIKDPGDLFPRPVPPPELPRKKVPFKETFETFEEFVKEWHGREARDETYNRYGYWENPNAKWDWYEIGGRWAGYFRLKPDHIGGIGSQYAAVYGKKLQERNDFADVAFKNGIDFEGMRRQAAADAATAYDKVWEAIKGTPEAESWEVVRSDFDLKNEPQLDLARKKYHAQERVQAFEKLARSKDGMEMFGFFANVETFQVPREVYLQRARDGAISTHAVLKDGKWYEQGQMGWWGIMHKEKDKDTWNSMFAQMLDELPDTALLVVIDCHI